MSTISNKLQAGLRLLEKMDGQEKVSMRGQEIPCLIDETSSGRGVRVAGGQYPTSGGNCTIRLEAWPFETEPEAGEMVTARGKKHWVGTPRNDKTAFSFDLQTNLTR